MRNQITRAYGITLFLLLPLVFFYFTYSVELVDSGAINQVNAITPFYLISVLLFTTYRVVRSCPDSIWTPAMWFPLQSAIFFGVGPLVEVFGNETTIYALQIHRLAITPTELFRSNTLSAVGIWAVLAGFWLHCKLNKRSWAVILGAVKKMQAPTLPPGMVALGFIVCGAVFKYGVIKPAQWGMDETVIPGILTSLSLILEVGFALVAFLAARGDKRMRLILLVFLPIHLLMTSLSFAKSEIVFAMLLPAIGAYIGHKSLRRLGVAFSIMTVVFVVAQPFIQHGRGLIFERTGTISQAGYGERIDIVRSYLFDESHDEVDEFEKKQGWWTRLNFAGVQAFAMKAYDMGLPGDTLRNAWMLFIPRAIWPEKPVIEGPGKVFYQLVTGRYAESFLALSIYGDIYWQFGWKGLVLICPLVGWFLAMITIRSINTISERDFILMPAVVMGMQIGILGPNKYLVNGIIGPMPIYFAYLLGVKMLSAAIKFSNRRTPTRSIRSPSISIR